MKKLILPGAIIILLLLAYFVFAPAFAGKLIISPTVDVGVFSFRLYGLTLAAAILTGYMVVRTHSWRFGISKQEVDDLSFWLTIVGIIGARLYFVAFDWQYFLSYPNEIYKIWHGGISIYGSLIAGLIFIWWYSKKKAYSKYQLLDLIALGLPLSQAVGRLGNFFNQEAFGLPTDLPWKMFVPSASRPLEYVRESFFHPTFLYEALGSMVIFLILKKLLGKSKPGVIALTYLALYSLLRFFIEPLRLDSVIIEGFKADQVVAFVVFVAAIGFIFKKQFIRKSVNTTS